MATWFRLLSVEVRQRIQRDLAETAAKNARATTVAKKRPQRSLDRVVIKPRQGRKSNHGYERGIAAEERFFEICNRFFELGSFPEWYLETMRGTIAEDSKGIDAKARICVFTKNRFVPIQIKSSEEGKRKFYIQARNRHIPCIIVNERQSDESIFAALIHEVTFIREQLLLRGR